MIEPEVKPPVDPVARSLAKPDAFAKPGHIGAAKSVGSKVRVRLTNEKVRGRPRKHRRDPRDVKFF